MQIIFKSRLINLNIDNKAILKRAQFNVQHERVNMDLES
jgi:hypothetical protein